MTDKDRELYEATTQGKWETRPGSSGQEVFSENSCLANNVNVANVAWIVRAHKRWPELLGEIERLKAGAKTAAKQQADDIEKAWREISQLKSALKASTVIMRRHCAADDEIAQIQANEELLK